MYKKVLISLTLLISHKPISSIPVTTSTIEQPATVELFLDKMVKINMLKNEPDISAQTTALLNDITNTSLENFIQAFFLFFNNRHAVFNTTVINYFTEHNQEQALLQWPLYVFCYNWLHDPNIAPVLITLLQKQKVHYRAYPFTEKYPDANHDDQKQLNESIFSLLEATKIPYMEDFLKEYIRIFPESLYHPDHNGDTLLHRIAKIKQLNLLIYMLPLMTPDQISIKNQHNKTAADITTNELCKAFINYYSSIDPNKQLPPIILDENAFLAGKGVSGHGKHSISTDTLIYAFKHHILSVNSYKNLNEASYNYLPFLHALVLNYGIKEAKPEVFTTAFSQYNLKISEIYTDPKVADIIYNTKQQLNALDFARTYNADPAVIAILEDAYNKEIISTLNNNLAILVNT